MYKYAESRWKSVKTEKINQDKNGEPKYHIEDAATGAIMAEIPTCSTLEHKNAQLIAAAPEMFYICEILVRWMLEQPKSFQRVIEKTKESERFFQILIQATAIMKKINGKQILGKY
jgi:hypothetical protein